MIRFESKHNAIVTYDFKHFYVYELNCEVQIIDDQRVNNSIIDIQLGKKYFDEPFESLEQAQLMSVLHGISPDCIFLPVLSFKTLSQIQHENIRLFPITHDNAVSAIQNALSRIDMSTYFLQH